MGHIAGVNGEQIRLGSVGRPAFVALVLMAWANLAAQVTVTSTSSSYTGWQVSGAGMFDAQGDQQTGVPSADFVGFAAGTTGLNATPTADVYGAMLGADASNMYFRFRLLDQNGNKIYMGSVISVGINIQGLTAAGSPTIFVTASSTNSAATLFFQSPGTGANNSPSTTTLSNFTGNPYSSTAPLALTSGTNFSYAAATTIDGAGSNFYNPGTPAKTYNNYFLTFAVSYADLQTAVRALTGNSTVTIGASTVMSFLAVTAQTSNSLNQDIYGTSVQASNTLTTTWTALGAFSDPLFANGSRIPEPATVVQAGMFALVGLVGFIWRRRRAGVP